MQLTLRKSALRAALHCAAVKDVRYYLNGVYLKRCGDQVLVAGTDGHVMFLGKVSPDNGDETPEDFEIIIPADAIKAATKGKKPEFVVLRPIGEHYQLGDTLFKPVDAKFPDVMRVVPHKVSGELAQFNPELLARAQKAIQEFTGRDKPIAGIHYNGDAGAVIPGPDCAVIVMPMRTELGDYEPFSMVPVAQEEGRKAA